MKTRVIAASFLVLSLSLLMACNEPLQDPPVDLSPMAYTPSPLGPCYPITASQYDTKPLVSSVNPGLHSSSVANSANLSVIFNHSMQTPNLTNYSLQGFQTSRLPGVYSGANTKTLSFNPNPAFKAGEQLELSLTRQLLSNKPVYKVRRGYEHLCEPYVYRFRAASTSTGPNNGSFTTEDYVLNNKLRDVITGDFNNDGNLDIVVADENNNRLILLYGRGDGSYCKVRRLTKCSDYAYLPAGPSPRVLVARDFDNNGKLDIAVGNDSYPGQVTLLSNTGYGFYPKGYSLKTKPYSINAGDLNGDSHPDIVVQGYDSKKQAVLINRGTGFNTGTAFSISEVSSGAEVPFVALGDVNNDGALDRIVANPNPDGPDDSNAGVRVSLGNNKGSFKAPTYYAWGVRPWSIVMADFNNDGFLDMATANHSGPEHMTVALNNGSGSFTTLTHYTVSSFNNFSDSLETTDFNADGQLDIIMINRSNQAAVFLATNDGFEPAVTYEVDSKPFYLAVGDLDNDGDVDVVSANDQSLTLLINQP